MARPEILKATEVELDTSFRLQITKWAEYQKDMEKFTWIKVYAVRPTDSMLFERLPTRGLFSELLRFAAASRRTGWVVLGADEPLTVSILASIMRLTIEEVFEPLKRLVETERVKLHKANSQLPESIPNNSKQPPPVVGGTTESIPNNPIKNRIEENRKEKKREEKKITSTCIDDFVALWKEHCPKLKGFRIPLNATRLDKIRRAFKAHPDTAYWQEVLTRANAAGFDGKNGKRWQPNIDYVLRSEGTRDKLLEGALEEKPGRANYQAHPNAAPPGKWDEYEAQMAREREEEAARELEETREEKEENL